jgi:hypothetical protein
MKQRSCVPGAAGHAGEPGLLRRLDRAEVDLLAAELQRGAALCGPNSSRSIPSTRWYQDAADLDVLAGDDEVVEPVDGEAHAGGSGGSCAPGRRAVTSISIFIAAVCSPAMDQGGGGLGGAEIALHHRPAGRPVGAVGHDEQHAHHVVQRGSPPRPARRRCCGRSARIAPRRRAGSSWSRSHSRWCRRPRCRRHPRRRGNSRSPPRSGCRRRSGGVRSWRHIPHAVGSGGAAAFGPVLALRRWPGIFPASPPAGSAAAPSCQHQAAPRCGSTTRAPRR